ncbi:hypothetical protein HET73_04135 [Wolbachia endosymbiont of Atemnus politus]|nr:hypothetical protein [Wolbachia endosymbiont of Atemnus politus]
MWCYNLTIRSNLKKKLRRKFVVLVLLIGALFISYFLIKNTSKVFNQTVVKEINIGVSDEE